jgi:hypothetical protein
MIIKKFQAGGAVAPVDPAVEVPQEAPMDPIQQIAEMAIAALQTQDCGTAMQVCEAFVAMLQQAQGGAPTGPVEEIPAGEPVFRKGGKLIRRK